MDLSIGARVGHLEIIGAPVTRDGKHAYSLVRCRCGKEWEVRRDQIRSGQTRSCGCGENRGRLSHGLARSCEYRSWASMLQRCHNPRAKAFAWYGARGISVCPQWRESFETFYADMGPRPARMSLERLDNERGYEPINCVWATHKEQMQNTRGTKHVFVRGQRLSIAEAARCLGIPPGRLYNRKYEYGEDYQQAVDHYVTRQGAA